MLCKFAACCIFLVQIPHLFAYSRLPLSGNKWIISENSAGTKVPGTVPGTPYTALLAQGKIQDPLYRDNDVQLAWIGRTNWTYSIDFTATAVQASAKQAALVCEGLDTFATLSLNGKVIGEANNMFIRWAFDISGMLQPGTNALTVAFTSAVLAAKEKADQSNYTIPPNCPPPVQHGECHVNQVRKEQCSFSWDWGPSFPTQGIWKPIYIETFDSAILKGLSAVVSKVSAEGQWKVDVEADFDVTSGSEVKGHLQATIETLNVSFSEMITLTSNQSRKKFTMTIPKETRVQLWWPNGHGKQPLYSLKAQFAAAKDGESTSRSVRIGFRTVELIQKPVTDNPGADQGLTFYFKVNGMPIFLKGSNWIPADSFQERITRDNVQYLLTSAANVSINALRVWGGGVYESDDFYDLCDELGILVWQDFMFSVALYPAYPQFLESVSLEILDQVRRLKHHASILVWAGSNENEKALRQDWFGVKDNFTIYYNDFIELYVTTIKPIVESEDPSRAYLTSSPTDGAESVRQGYVAQDPGSELYGDIHFYDYAADQWNASVFRIPRMASEYGIQSWCNIESLADVFQPSDFDVKSKMVDHRQHHAMGNTEMTAEVSMHLQLPQTADPHQYFTEFVYLTQINQAMSMRTQTEHYRRHQSGVLKDGRGLTMGALYWQLNDIWQAPTWASIDYKGRWKMLHYFARNFFKDLLISPYRPDPNTLDVFIVVDEILTKEDRSPSTGSVLFRPVSSLNDLRNLELPGPDLSDMLHQTTSVTEGQLLLEVYQYSSFKPIHSIAVPFKLKTTAESVFTKPVADLLQESGCPGPEHCLVNFTATDKTGRQLSTNWFMFTYPKHAVLSKASLKIVSVTQRKPTVFDIRVSADAPALFVWLSAGNVLGHFSDNGFHMFTPTLQIQFFARQPVSVANLQTQLSVRCVQNKAASVLSPLKVDSESAHQDSDVDANVVHHWNIPQ